MSSRLATSVSTWSPAGWPNRSFTDLKWSTSTRSRPTLDPTRRARRATTRISASRYRRLRSPVRPSVIARCRCSASSRAIRAMISSMIPALATAITRTSRRSPRPACTPRTAGPTSPRPHNAANRNPSRTGTAGTAADWPDRASEGWSAAAARSRALTIRAASRPSIAVPPEPPMPTSLATAAPMRVQTSAASATTPTSTPPARRSNVARRSPSPATILTVTPTTDRPAAAHTAGTIPAAETPPVRTAGATRNTQDSRAAAARNIAVSSRLAAFRPGPRARTSAARPRTSSGYRRSRTMSANATPTVAEDVRREMERATSVAAART